MSENAVEEIESQSIQEAEEFSLLDFLVFKRWKIADTYFLFPWMRKYLYKKLSECYKLTHLRRQTPV